MEKGLYKIHSDTVQLSLCRSSLWNDDAAGFPWYLSLFASAAIYTGAFQFVLITFLSSSASMWIIGVTAFLYGGKKWTIVKKVFCTFSVRRFSLR